MEYFENTRLNKQATVINKDESVGINVSGAPAAISFASINESCSVLIEFGGHKKIINMCRRKTGKLSFVLKQIPLYGFLGNSDVDIDKSNVKITAINKYSGLWDDKAMQKAYGMIPAGKKT